MFHQAPCQNVSSHHNPISIPDGVNRFDAQSPGYIIIRWLQFTLLLITIGAVLFRYAVVGRMERQLDVNTNMVSVAKDKGGSHRFIEHYSTCSRRSA